jgi:FtsH-binding integral membrane protein
MASPFTFFPGEENMALDPRFMTRAQAQDAQIDVGLRQYMLGVYNHMTIGMAITGLVALAASWAAIQDGQLTAFGHAIYVSPLKWVVMLAPIGMVFLFAAKVQSMAASTAQMVFWVFAALMGLSLSSIFLVYTGASITRVFFITAGMFAGMSLYGYTTKKDLTGIGSFLFMGLIGILIASVVNIFLASTMLHFVISVVGVLVFAGLTAYDTQAIKNEYWEGDDVETQSKKSINGALRLYLDFINLFMMLLHLFGNRE